VIACIVGTTAELIKIAPVFHALMARGTKPQLWFTAWHVREVSETLDDLRLPEPDVWLVPRESARHMERPGQVPRWAATVARTAYSRWSHLRKALTDDGQPPLVVVHGDTFTTPYGALLGRRLGAQVAHVEAGVRSGNLLDPIPEEANRRVAGRLADIHFAPTAREVANLRGARGIVVGTSANTVVDALRFARDEVRPPFPLPERFGLVTLHRFELLRRAARYREVLEALRDASAHTPLIYLVGAPEQERLDRLGLRRLFDGERFVLRPKLRYLAFQPVLTRAAFVVTDSGGLEEECAYLGIPCAIHRERTERHGDLGPNLMLTGMRTDRLTRFLDDPAALRVPSTVDLYHPSETIAATLADLGFC
jgi:UDP-N-acetylglucosamine 2-epimerase (non-hydrolysing)